MRQLVLFCMGVVALGPAAVAAAPQVIELNQVACQFLESENGQNHGYKASQAADCVAVNERTADERIARAKVLELKAGQYIFRVTNVDVPYELGFWVRGQGLVDRARLPSVSGGGLTVGLTRDYEIELEPGNYVYSCPLNPTLDYRLVVTR